jgi:hypothetical protein
MFREKSVTVNGHPDAVREENRNGFDSPTKEKPPGKRTQIGGKVSLVLASVEYQNPSTGAARTAYEEVYTVNALGDNLTYTDRAGNVHTYSHAVLGRQTADVITTLASGFGNTVLRIQSAYNALGNPYLISSYNAASHRPPGGRRVQRARSTEPGIPVPFRGGEHEHHACGPVHLHRIVGQQQ